MSLKLREMWNECEKMEPELLRVFVDGLMEMVESRHAASLDCLAIAPVSIDSAEGENLD